MNRIGEMFLKAADFRIIEKTTAGPYNTATIGYRVSIKGQDYGSFITTPMPLDDAVRKAATELFKEEAFDVCMMMVGCHA